MRDACQPGNFRKMTTSPPPVRPTNTAGRLLLSVKDALKRSGAEQIARQTTIRVARPTYTRSLRLVPNREELPYVLNALGLTGVAAEVGVARGKFSEHILTHWRGERLISIDPWLEMAPGEYVDACNQGQEDMEDSYQMTRDRLAPFGTRSQIWRETGQEAASRIDRQSLDFVYIDARHDYDSVVEDLQQWFPLLRPGGIIAGHDYNDGEFREGIHGVRSAVDGFFAAQHRPVHHTVTDMPCLSWIVRA
jgi:hypothetical protein